MALYAFQTDGGIGHDRDPAEIELESVRDAQIEAVTFLGELLRDRAEKFWDHQDATVTVRDETGLILFTLTLSAMLAPVLQPGAGA